MKSFFSICLLSLIMLTGCGKEKPKEPTTNHFKFSYELTLDSFPKEYDNLEIIIPLARNYDFQQVNKRDIITKLPYKIITDSLYNNEFLYVNSDSLFDNCNIKVVYDITREENHSIENEQTGVKLKVPQRYLEPDSLVPIDGKVADEAAQFVDEQMTNIDKAHALYNHLFETMSYDKSGEGWGRGDAIYACDIRKGNCTDFHSLFIGMCRSQKIPARFKMGFNLPADKAEGEVGGYHCWAEFYPGGNLWIPVDISEASKDPSKKDYLFGNLDYNRVEFTLGRDIPLMTDHGLKNLNYSIYPTVFIDGQNHSTFKKKFYFKKM